MDENQEKSSEKSESTPEPDEDEQQPSSSNVEQKTEGESLKRFDFLLKQTEFFSKFLNASKIGAQNVQENEDDTNDGDRRHRQSRVAADDELLEGLSSAKSKSIMHFDTTPHYIKNGEMRDYQIRGLNWIISLMDNRLNGILADEMGLGKTLQTISFLGYLKHFRRNNGPHIVIVPKSTLQNWLNELKRWCPSLKVICVIGEKGLRKQYISDILHGTEWDVCVTSYEMCLLESSAFRRFTWNYLIIDEAHRIKNEGTKLAEILRLYKSTHRLLLTGTPLQNNLHELWSLLNFLLPDVFGSSDDFDTWFTTNSCFGDKALVARLHTILKPFLLRRLKSEVEKSLLPKKEVKVYVGMSKMQREWYSKVLLKDIDILTAMGTAAKMRVANVLMHLRKVTNHPYLFDSAEDGPPYDQDLKHVVQNSGKMVILDKLLDRLKAQGSRVLLFSQMTRMLDILEDYCVWRGHSYCRLDGQTPHEDRSVMIDAFNAENSPTFLFMLSTRAGGLGINLATADSVIIYDSDWNPQVDLQAIDRAHRIGQKKQVRVFRLVSENTVDEKIIERGEIKLRLDRMVIQNGLVEQQSANLQKEEMANIIRFGANQILNSKESNVSDEDIDTILKKCEERTQKEQKILDKMEAEGEGSLRKFTLDTDESISLYTFEGEDYLEKQKELHSQKFIQLPKRNRSILNYTATAFYQHAQTKTAPKHVRDGPSVPKQVPFMEHQFHSPRLFDLYEKENLYYRKSVAFKVPSSESARKERQAKIDNAKPLTEMEEAEKQRLLKEGFSKWSKQNFTQFVKGIEQFGRDDLKNIATYVDFKTPEEVAAYSRVFWKRYTELKDHKRIISQIERSDNIRERQLLLSRALDEKVSDYSEPFFELKIKYPPDRNSVYSTKDDSFLICKLHQLGITTDNVYGQLRTAVRASATASKHLKSRTAIDLHGRCSYLLFLIEKEMRERRLGIDLSNGETAVERPENNTPQEIKQETPINTIVLDSSDDEEQPESKAHNGLLVEVNGSNNTPLAYSTMIRAQTTIPSSSVIIELDDSSNDTGTAEQPENCVLLKQHNSDDEDEVTAKRPRIEGP